MCAEIQPSQLQATGYRLDPDRSTVEFHVPTYWGLTRVKGRFERFQGTLDLRSEPAAQLTIDAASLTTKNNRRDQHLRSADFFDVANHPEVGIAATVELTDGGTLKVRGKLAAAGKEVPLELDAAIRDDDGGLQIDAETEVDQRQLGMTWNRVGMIRSPARLIVHAHLVAANAGGGSPVEAER